MSRRRTACTQNSSLMKLGAGNMGYDEGVLRPDLLIVEAGRTNMVNAKRRDREAALLGEHHMLHPTRPRRC